MIKISVKILHCLVLLVTGVALMGVNVKQLYCCHAENTHWEVHIIPADDKCPCDEGCCQNEGCHNQTRHDFYKITDFPQIEPGVQLTLVSFYLTESPLMLLSYLPVLQEKYFSIKPEAPDIPILRELLCTDLC